MTPIDLHEYDRDEPVVTTRGRIVDRIQRYSNGWAQMVTDVLNRFGHEVDEVGVEITATHIGITMTVDGERYGTVYPVSMDDPT
ncbi:MAG: hypothetical protein F4Y04_05030 [Chloroflexi bacterium]|nr:hypothetical protein [Chloroflexota bacterium]